MKKLLPFLLIISLAVAGGSTALAAPIQWTDTQGEVHWYDVIQFVGGWEEARLDAITHEYGGLRGHLATITSSDEQAFLWGNLDFNAVNYGIWIGGYQFSKDNEPSGNWAWVTGEAWEYTNWYSSEPNNANNDEDYLEFRTDNVGYWNDMHVDWFTEEGYIVEYDNLSDSVPGPAAILLLGSGLAGLAGFRRKFNKR